MYSDIVETASGQGTENEYQEIAGEQAFDRVPSANTCSDVTLTKEALQSSVKPEYLPPPPFAPGY